MTSQPTSGPGSGVIASQLTTISSAQIKALFTTPVAVSPTPRSAEIIAPLHWAATAENSATFYDNIPGGQLGLGYSAAAGLANLGTLLTGLTLGEPSFVRADSAVLNPSAVVDAAGLPVLLFIDAGNLTSGNFPIAFTLFYAVIPS